MVDNWVCLKVTLRVATKESSSDGISVWKWDKMKAALMEHDLVDSKDGKKVDGMGYMSVVVLVGPLAMTKALQVVA
jgi:hypothetical protein